MHFSIAPVEITTHMAQQFTTTPPTRRHAAARHGVMRHRLSAVLHGLAARLEPTPSH